MLAEDMAGRPYNKARHRRSLMPLLRNRTEGSIEVKHHNVSAVLKGLGEDWIPGYTPAFNFQMTLVDAVAGRDERNRALGCAGEESAVAFERSALKMSSRDDLSRKVRWISKKEGDGTGYHIASFTPDGQERLIEVKSTNGRERTPFYISCNELARVGERWSEWSCSVCGISRARRKHLSCARR